MRTNTTGLAAETHKNIGQNTVFRILVAISFCHLLNDMLQSLIPAIYPILKTSFQLTFAQLGLITLTFQATASLLQPFVGYYTDMRPKPFSLPVGMGLTLLGLILLSVATDFLMLLIAAALVGTGSAVFHPESSRVARMAAGLQPGLAQSVFQVGGNTGSSLGPLLAAFVVLPRGRSSVAWFSLGAIVAILVLTQVGVWYKRNPARTPRARTHPTAGHAMLFSKKITLSIAVLIALIFSKYFYLVSLTSYYTFYLMSKFHVSVRNAQLHLFIFLGAIAAGTILGGPVGDRFGRKYVIWCSILGVLPFTLALPYANLFWTGVLSAIIGVILASAFSAILVYAQDLVPGKVGMISGLFFGLAFGMAGIGAALLGELADLTSIGFVYHVCSFLPAIGILTWFLPDLERMRLRQSKSLP
ncbi:MAG: MFS transporter [Acidobacteriaceae bacterium]|nr:MFS transporter [Acidobacteriaceae bacterium]MBV9779185.1 MFS transporter [Acidobacteriaceae bacterium]